MTGEHDSVADLIQAVLDERRVSERTLARELQVSPNAINSWLRGMRVPDPPYVWRIAEMAGVSIDYAMRLAGHLPPAEDGDRQHVRARERHLAAIAAELEERDLDLLVQLAETMLRWREEG